MGAHPPPVLDASDLNDTDERLIDLLYDGRVTPQYAAGILEVSRTYASERLKRLVEHGHVDKLASGLYELGNDPRQTGMKIQDESDLLESLQEQLAEVTAERDRLADELEDCREQLEAARDGSVDVGIIQYAIRDLKAACERGDSGAVQEAIERIEEAIDE